MSVYDTERCMNCHAYAGKENGTCLSCGYYPPEFDIRESQDVEEEIAAGGGGGLGREGGHLLRDVVESGYPQIQGGATPEERKVAKSGGGADTVFHMEEGKDRVELLPKEVLRSCSRPFAYGVGKYGYWNWAEHSSKWEWLQLVGSTLRHIFAWEMREDMDEESGCHHLDMAIADLMMLRSLTLKNDGTDNRGPA